MQYMNAGDCNKQKLIEPLGVTYSPTKYIQIQCGFTNLTLETLHRLKINGLPFPTL